ncbi:MAG: hypothetical protein WCS34_07970 [Bacteroidales bacterium]
MTNNYKYSNIHNLRELQYQRRLLSSQIESQEDMITYKTRTIRDYASPKRWLYLGLESIADKNPFINIVLKIINIFKNTNKNA